MQIIKATERLVNTERQYTAKILHNLMVIENKKLYSELKFSSLYNYLVKGLKYSDAEATVRVNAVRLMNKSKTAEKKVKSGELSLSNACEANKILGDKKEKAEIQKVVDFAATESNRTLKEFGLKFNLGKKDRKETVILNERLLIQMDRLRKKYGDMTNLELILMLVEQDLKTPLAKQRGRSCDAKVSRFIPKQVKLQVYTGMCENCGVRYNLEYDHIKKHSAGGTNTAENIQILCRNCNQRKEIRAKESGFFS